MQQSLWHDLDLGRPIAAPLERCAELLGVDLASSIRSSRPPTSSPTSAPTAPGTLWSLKQPGAAAPAWRRTAAAAAAASTAYGPGRGCIATQSGPRSPVEENHPRTLRTIGPRPAGGREREVGLHQQPAALSLLQDGGEPTGQGQVLAVLPGPGRSPDQPPRPPGRPLTPPAAHSRPTGPRTERSRARAAP